MKENDIKIVKCPHCGEDISIDAEGVPLKSGKHTQFTHERAVEMGKLGGIARAEKLRKRELKKPSLSPAEEECRRVKEETFRRDLRECADYLLSVQKVERLRKQNPKWREMR